MGVKRCTKCGDAKLTAEFHKRTKSKDGLSPWCRVCMSAAVASWRERNLERSREQSREWNKRHPERRAEAKARYRSRPDCPEAALARENYSTEQRSEKSRRAREALTDGYVRGLLSKHMPERGNIPQSLVELKRAQLIVTSELGRMAND